MKSLIVAREREQAVLARLLEEPTAQLLTVYGRRRIGKTFLIREYFDDNFTFKHTAISPLEFKDKEEKLLYRIQLDEFAHSLEKYGAKVESKRHTCKSIGIILMQPTCRQSRCQFEPDPK